MKTQEKATLPQNPESYVITVPGAAYEGWHVSKGMNKAIWNTRWYLIRDSFSNPKPAVWPETSITPKALARILKNAWCVRQITFVPEMVDGLSIEKGGDGGYTAIPETVVRPDVKRIVKAFKAGIMHDAGDLRMSRTASRKLLETIVTPEEIQRRLDLCAVMSPDDIPEAAARCAGDPLDDLYFDGLDAIEMPDADDPASFADEICDAVVWGKSTLPIQWFAKWRANNNILPSTERDAINDALQYRQMAPIATYGEAAQAAVSIMR